MIHVYELSRIVSSPQFRQGSIVRTAAMAFRASIMTSRTEQALSIVAIGATAEKR